MFKQALRMPLLPSFAFPAFSVVSVLCCSLAAGCRGTPSASDLLAELSPYIQLDLTLVHTHPSMKAGPPPERLLERASAVMAELNSRSDPEAHHAMLALDLALRPRDAAIVERVVAGLERLRESRPHDLELQNDLAVAYAARASTARRSDGVFRALDLIAEAAQSEDAPPEVLSNRATLLRRLGVIADSTPARTDAGRVRELVLDSLLPAWGRGSDADALLAQSKTLARSLDGRLDGVIAAAENGGSAIRQAHTQYGAARTAYRTGNFVRARGLFRDAQFAAQTANSPLQSWAEIYALATAVQTSGDPQPLHRLERAAEALPPELTALRGVAYMTLALASGRRGMLAEAIAYDAIAIACFGRIGEFGNAAVARLLDTEIHWILGNDRAAIEKLLHAFTEFQGDRASVTFLNLLLVGAGILQDAGLPHAALSVLAEARQVALGTGRELDPPSADLRFARVLQMTGREQEAATILEIAGKRASTIADTLMRQRLAAEIAEVRAAVMPPDSALDVLDRVVDYYAHQNFSAGEVRSLVARGEHLQARGEVTAAVRDFERALHEVERTRGAITDAGLRATLTSSVRPALDRLLAMALDRGDTLGGLYLAARVNGSTLSAVPRLSGAECNAALVLALLPDRLATWVITPNGLHLRTTQVSQRDISRTVRALHAAMRRSPADSIANEALRVLGNIVIGPVEDLIRDCGRLTIVADRELHHVPFAALRIPGNGRFLLEEHVIQVLPSMQWLASESPRQTPSSALLVGVSSPSTEYPDLPRLDGVTAEVTAIAQHYSSPTVLSDDAAGPNRLLAEIERHDVLHFAGHALTPARRPDLAHLVLTQGTIQIEQLRRLDLSRLQLAVLASCATLGDFSEDSQGFGSIARAFLEAGAGGVVGTLWEIEDRNAQELLTEFHRQIATGEEPAAALREAQLKGIREEGRRRGEIANWAGYRYEGR